MHVMSRCRSCGHANREESTFCTRCGIRLAEIPAAGLIRCGVLAQEEAFEVSQRTTLVGRDKSNDIVLDDEHASSRHALISFAGDVFWIEDLNSRNGTFVNGEQIRERRILHEGYLIKIGNAILKFVLR